MLKGTLEQPHPSKGVPWTTLLLKGEGLIKHYDLMFMILSDINWESLIDNKSLSF